MFIPGIEKIRIRVTIAQKFGFLLVGEYIIAAFLFGQDHNLKKAIYFIACALKDITVILL